MDRLIHYKESLKQIRIGYLYDEPSDIAIAKTVINNDFGTISKYYDFNSKDGSMNYVNRIL